MLVQPATVARWHREGFRGCWRRRSRRRPGRPRIDVQLGSLIGRMATENCLWGAPRIHGELLQLGFTVSERTVSRYLPDRLTRRSQTWRTFLANHIGSLAFASTVTSSFVTSDDDVDAFVLRCRPVLPSRDGRCACAQGPWVDWPPSLQSTSLGWCVAQDQLPRRTRTRFSSGKDPPKWDVEPVLVAYGWRFLTSRDPSRPKQPISGLSPGSLCAQSGRPHRWRTDSSCAPSVEAHVYQQRLSEYWRGTGYLAVHPSFDASLLDDPGDQTETPRQAQAVPQPGSKAKRVQALVKLSLICSETISSFVRACRFLELRSRLLNEDDRRVCEWPSRSERNKAGEIDCRTGDGNRQKQSRDARPFPTIAATTI